MTSVLAIDPGNVLSAYVLLNGDGIQAHGKVDNTALLEMLRGRPRVAPHVAIEMVASYGMPVGRTVFETVLWAGRFAEASGSSVSLLYRQDIKWHLCGRRRGLKDKDVRAALIARYGGKDKLPGITADRWAALAVAVTWWDKHAATAGTLEAAP